MEARSIFIKETLERSSRKRKRNDIQADEDFDFFFRRVITMMK